MKFTPLFLRSCLTLLCCAVGLHAVGQQQVKVGGTIRDENGQAIELATVHLEGTAIGTISNLRGHYSLRFESRDTLTLVYSMLGYQTRKRRLVRPRGNLSIDMVLPAVEMQLEGVVISELKRQTGTTHELNAKAGRLMPDASGAGVESLLATQAGVSNNNELSSQYNVRGGSFEENMVYVNGIEVYRPLLIRSAEQEGLSFINPDMVGSIRFSTGGYEAKYGDRISSVLDITYRQPTRTEASASASLLGVSAYVGLAGKKFTWSNGWRYKTNQYLLGTLDTKGEYNPSYIDYQTYLQWTPGRRWEVGMIGNISENRFRFRPEDRYTRFGTLEQMREFKVYFEGGENDLFRTFTGSFHTTFRPSDKHAFTLRASAFHTREQETYDLTGQYWLSDADAQAPVGIGTYMEHARNYLKATVQTLQLSGEHRFEGHTLRWGVEARNERISDRMREWELRDSAGYSMPHTSGGPELFYTLTSRNSIESRRAAAYLQDTYRFRSSLGLFTLTAGLRASYWSWNREWLLSPRASLSLIPAFNDRFTLRLAAGIYYQSPFYKELRDTLQTGGVAAVRLNANIRSPRSIHLVAGGDYHFKALGRNFRFSAEAYYKALSRLIPYTVENVSVNYYGRNLSSGYATGLDMNLFGEFVAGTDSWLSLSLMKTQEKLAGVWMPRPTDQRYRLSLYFNDYFPGSRRWTMSLKATLAGGLPFGPPHAGLEAARFRTPPYRRVDIGMSHHLVDRTNGVRGLGIRSVWIGVDVFNLLNIQNVNSYYWVTDSGGAQFAVPNYLTSRRLNVRLLLEL
ncbi:MAG: TonB-dependent receptor [Prevotellaceae bacterium]|jgi:hypothetical protein|nr:TonB-dependent receptor [Prevotellaceae bacterium]